MKIVKKHSRYPKGTLNFVVAGFVFIGLLIELYMIYTDKLALSFWGLGFSVLLLVSNLVIGILENRGLLFNNDEKEHLNQKLKRIDKGILALIIILTGLFIYYTYEMVINALKTKVFSPLTPTLLPIIVLSVILIIVITVRDRKIKR